MATNGLNEVDSSSPLTVNYKQFVKDKLAEWNIAGAAIAVVDGDSTFSEAFGYASLPDKPATTDTLWYFGSAIKTSTAAILAHLIDTKAYPSLPKGWATPVSTILPEEFVLPDDWATKHVTLEDLVCHRSGMNRHDLSIPAIGRNGEVLTLADQVRNVRNLSFTHEPRTEHNYCNYGYLILSCVIEKVTGKAFKDVLREVLWEPLGMESTYYDTEDVADEVTDRLSNGYCWDSKTQENVAVSPGLSLSAAAGAGAGITTVRDVAKLMHCFIHETKPFSKATHVDMKQPRTIDVPQPHFGTDISTYGLGVYRTIYRNQPVYSHPGTIDSHGCEVMWLPELKFGVVLMANGSGTSNRAGKALVHRLIDDKLRIPEAERTDFNAIFKARHEAFCGMKISGEDIFYPNRPNPPLPPSLNVTKLAGSYYATSHGALNLRVVSNSNSSGDNLLVANREDTCFIHTMELQHVSGDEWLASVTAMGMTVPFAAKFFFSADGAPSGVEVDYTIPPLGMDEGPVLFERVN